MIIKTEVSLSDYKTFNAYVCKRSVKINSVWGWLKNFSVWLLITIIFMSFFQHISGSKSIIHWHTVFTIFIPLIIYFVVIRIEQVKIVKHLLPNENGIMLGAKEFEISETGIKERHSFGYCFYSWSAVESVEDNNGTVYIFVDRIMALILPPASFRAEASKDEFLRVVRLYQL